MTKKISGTKEWAVANANCLDGCEHGCRYCYARTMALRFNRIEKPEDWTRCTIREEEVKKGRHHRKGTVMFPTTHDITPAFLQPCLTVLQKLIKAGNKVLVVTKPHLSCIQEIHRVCTDNIGQILFRFTITADDDAVLSYWEPHAPSFLERVESLKYAYQAGCNTSVSVEPMLDAPNVVRLFHALEPWVNDAIWIGKMNKVRSRVHIATEEDETQVRRIEENQTDDHIHAIYEALRNERKIKWKESFKSILGLPLAEEAGLDV